MGPRGLVVSRPSALGAQASLSTPAVFMRILTLNLGPHVRVTNFLLRASKSLEQRFWNKLTLPSQTNFRTKYFQRSHYSFISEIFTLLLKSPQVNLFLLMLSFSLLPTQFNNLRNLCLVHTELNFYFYNFVSVIFPPDFEKCKKLCYQYYSLSGIKHNKVNLLFSKFSPHVLESILSYKIWNNKE